MIAIVIAIPESPRFSSLSISVIFAFLFAWSNPAQAQHNQGRLIKVLQDGGKDFRIRMQAAFHLGKNRHRPARKALENILRKKNEDGALRAAAATALGRIGERESLPTLRAVKRDSNNLVRLKATHAIQEIESLVMGKKIGRTRRAIEAGSFAGLDKVDWRRARFLLTVDDVHTNATNAKSGAARFLRREMEHGISTTRGLVHVARRDVDDSKLRKRMARHRLPHFAVDCALQKIEKKNESGRVAIRVEVLLTLVDAQSKAIRGSLSGAATAQSRRGGRLAPGENLAEQAIAAAVRSALGGVLGALERAAIH